VNLRRATRMPPADVVIELDTPEELFYADPSGLLTGSNRIDSGMDELVERILALKNPSSDQRIVLDVAHECSEELAATLVVAVHRNCELRRRRAVRELDLIWRQGKRSLLNGSLLFVVGIALSYLFTRPWVPELPGELLGNGVFLVVAWVGLWYPLDLLFIAREQAKREISVLSQMVAMPVVVRAHVGTMAVTAVPRSRTSPTILASLNTRFRRSRGPSKAGL
jgi:hypothetical protein